MLNIEGLTAGYGRAPVLDGVTCAVQDCGITAIVGRNGCGKSTLISCISGGLKYRGKILCAGRDLQSFSPRERATQVGVLPQLLPTPAVTVRQLVSFGRTPYVGFGGRLSPQDHMLVYQAMESAGILELQDRLVSMLSGGERQRAFLAMVLAQDTPLLILDEPTTHMDAEHAETLFSLLTNLRDRGKTVLAVLHDLSAALRCADRIIVLNAGRVAFSGTPEAALDTDLFHQVFGVQTHIFFEHGQRYVVFDV